MVDYWQHLWYWFSLTLPVRNHNHSVQAGPRWRCQRWARWPWWGWYGWHGSSSENELSQVCQGKESASSEEIQGTPEVSHTGFEGSHRYPTKTGKTCRGSRFAVFLWAAADQVLAKQAVQSALIFVSSLVYYMTDSRIVSGWWPAAPDRDTGEGKSSVESHPTGEEQDIV